jgi:hypothetical protein
VHVADSGAVYRKYKASVEISSGGRVYTEDSGIGILMISGRPYSQSWAQER